MIEAIKLFAIGILLGLANIIPGVSGGTMAIVFNVYENIIAIISFNIKKNLKRMEVYFAAWFGNGIWYFFI